MAGLAGTFAALHVWHAPVDYPTILGQTLVAGLVYVGLVFCVTLVPEERRRLVDLVRNSLARLRLTGNGVDEGDA